MLQEKFLKLLKKYGYWKCRNIKRPGTGAFIRCPGDPIHSCPFLFEPPIKAQITKIPPRFPNIEQKRGLGFGRSSFEVETSKSRSVYLSVHAHIFNSSARIVLVLLHRRLSALGFFDVS